MSHLTEDQCAASFGFPSAAKLREFVEAARDLVAFCEHGLFDEDRKYAHLPVTHLLFTHPEKTGAEQLGLRLSRVCRALDP